MQVLSDEHARAWCRARGVISTGTLPSKSLGYEGHTGRRIRVRIAGAATDVVGLAYILTITETLDFEESKFPGALLWLRRWEVWSESIDKVGYALLIAVRTSSGHPSTLEASPGQLFTSGEFTEAHACVILPMLFQWDAHVVSATGQFIAFISHEGYVDIACSNEAVYASLRERLKTFDPLELSVNSAT